MLRSSYTNSTGNYNSFTNANHSYSRLIESYALCKSIKAKPSYRLHLILCAIIVDRMNACSIVEWCLLKPAWVGACRFISVAAFVNRLFMTAMNTLDKGGVMAMLL